MSLNQEQEVRLIRAELREIRDILDRGLAEIQHDLDAIRRERDRQAEAAQQSPTRVIVCADKENNAEAWWDALGTQEPYLSMRLRADAGNAGVSLTADEFARVQALPGWSDPDAPAYAPHPLVVRG
jgi:hypothetical protein